MVSLIASLIIIWYFGRYLVGIAVGCASTMIMIFAVLLLISCLVSGNV